jgi:hypothetical protein
MQISESIEIDATVSQVWEILTDLDAYELWNPFIISASGTPAVGEKFTARFKPPGSKAMTMHPRVTALDVDRRFAWLGHALVPGLFDGAHEFVLEATADGGTRLTQSETFGGVLAPLFKGTIERSREGFRQFNEALATRATTQRSDA